MKLATVTDVLTRMNKAGISASNTDVIASSLEASTVVIETILGTQVSYNQLVDYYDYLPTSYSLYKPFRIRLSQRFTDGDVTVYNTTVDGVPLRSVSDLTDTSLATVVDTTEYVVDGVLGEVQFIYGLVAGYSSIAVMYEAGFEDLDDTSGEVDERVPTWLHEAAISGAVFAHHQQSQSHSKKDVKDMSSPLYQFMRVQLGGYMHKVHNDLLPSRTEVI